jgi:S-adenosyl-L-methionine hydrolase (adenosine-forming)
MNRPVITLLTDFGTTDHYVATMKGVILGICPDAQLVDITHQIPPYQILEAAFTLSQAWPYFPPGTIHLTVVDPGVGSSRRPLLAEAGGHLFVAPDNGVLTLVRKATGILITRELTAERFFRHPVSRTFHGRDIFAPVAAHLATGVPPAEFGSEVYNPVILPAGEPVETSPGVWTGTILHVDHFGNIVTNFPAKLSSELVDFKFEVRLGQYGVSRHFQDYSTSKVGELFLIPGSSGYLEISARQANAASRLGISIADTLTLRLTIP